jgi:hypothetical protein
MKHFAMYQSFLDQFYSLTQEKPEKLEVVYERICEGCRDLLVLKFTTKWLTVLANSDDDTIAVRVDNGPSGADLALVRECRTWESLIGQEYGWGWIALNQQGYCDSILLSFEGPLEPRVLLYVSGSSIRQFNITPIDNSIPRDSGDRCQKPLS